MKRPRAPWIATTILSSALSAALITIASGCDGDDDASSDGGPSGKGLSDVLGRLGLGRDGANNPGSAGGSCEANCANLKSCVDSLCSDDIPLSVCTDVCAVDEVPAVDCGGLQQLLNEAEYPLWEFCQDLTGGSYGGVSGEEPAGSAP